MRLSYLRTLLIVAAVATIAAAAGGEAWNWFRAFRGELCVGLGKTERLAICEAKPGTGIPLLDGRRDVRGVTADAIPFDEPGVSAKTLGSGLYDGVRLPFRVALKQARVLHEEQPHNLVKISGMGPERTVDVQGGLELAGETYKLDKVRKWSGLMRYAAGQPLAALSLRRSGEDWTENLFLAADDWRRVEPSVGLHCSWSDSEALSQRHLAAGLPGIEAARWGVVENAAVDWSKSFLSGSGADLRNGGTATLMKVDESGEEPFIEVQFIEGGRRSLERIVANRRDANARVCFEYFPRLESVIMLDAFDDDKAVCEAYHKVSRSGRSCGQKTLSAGDTWLPDGFPYEIRLDQVLRHALPVSEKDSTVYEAILQGAGRTLRLRQGEAVRVGDALLQFSREADPPQLSYDFRILDDAPGRERPLSLAPGENKRVGDWRLSLAAPAADPAHAAVLEVQYNPLWSPTRIALAGGVAGLGCIVMFGRSESEPEPEPPARRVSRKRKKPAKKPGEEPSDPPKKKPAKESSDSAKKPPRKRPAKKSP